MLFLIQFHHKLVHVFILVCMRSFVCVYVCIFLCLYASVCICVHLRVLLSSVCACVLLCACVHLRVLLSSVCACVFLCACVHLCVPVFFCVCLCAYDYRGLSNLTSEQIRGYVQQKQPKKALFIYKERMF